MTDTKALAKPEERVCPSCSARVAAQRFVAGGGMRTWLWRCDCGWCSAVSESGVLSRTTVDAWRAAKG